MTIALLADIHGNIQALEAVLNDMPAVDAVLCAGDVGGYYPYTNEVCDKLREFGAFVIRGNHDAYITGELQPNPNNVAAYGTEKIREALNPSHFDWLKALPIEMRFEWRGRHVRLRHASPWDEETYLYPDSPCLSKINIERSEILVVGHTHRPMSKICGEGLLVNPGSVGQPRDWNPMACYALVGLEAGSVTHRRVAYDVPGLQDLLAKMNWNAKAIEILGRTR